ncbi:MAG TPA: peptidylprolyl isomerase [Candidatus Binataceae bacterium]|nr:peptidylprolyl isomerase [Candidatus Binataceae bacterium]
MLSEVDFSMRRIFSSVGLTLRLAAAVVVCASLAVGIARAQEVDKVVASVDGDPITMHDVRVFTESAGKTLPPGDPTQEPAFKEGLKGLIAEKLLTEEMKRYDDKIDEDQIDNYIKDVEQDRNITDAQLKESLMQNGVSWEDFRKHAKVELEKMTMVNEELREHVTILPEQIEAYYKAHPEQFTVKEEKYKLAQILVAVPANATPAQVAAAKAKAEEARKKAIAGEDFAELAKQYSDDESKAQGGELGVFSPDDIMDEILAGIKNVPAGEISPVVRTKHGFHIIKVERHEVPGVRPLALVKEDIRNHLVDEQSRGRMQNWVETELVKQHDVETLY